MTDFINNLGTVLRAKYADPAAREKAKFQLIHLAQVSGLRDRTQALENLSLGGINYKIEEHCPCPNCPRATEVPKSAPPVRKMESFTKPEPPVKLNKSEPSKPVITPAKPTSYRAAKKSYVYQET